MKKDIRWPRAKDRSRSEFIVVPVLDITKKTQESALGDFNSPLKEQDDDDTAAPCPPSEEKT